MCLTVIAKPQPRFNFDGKVGIWFFTEETVAQRNSKNRAAGTPLLKPIDSVTGDVWADLVINKVIPAVRRKFSWVKELGLKDPVVRIQLDNAK